MSQYKTIKVKLTGEAPLLLHNGELANPLSSAAKSIKEISSKRKKTDADYIELAKREWYGSLYLDEKGRACIPGEIIEAATADGAKKFKMGKVAKGSLYSDGNWPIKEDGKEINNIDSLWEDNKHTKVAKVTVGMASVMRTRPIFNNWTVECNIVYNENTINEKQVLEFLNAEGVAIGDWRPKFGRFTATKV